LSEAPQVFRSLAKWGDDDFNHSQAVIQIPAEPMVGNVLGQIAVRRRDHPDVHATLTILANATDLVVLENAKQFHLHRKGHLTHFVEQQRPAVRGFEKTGSFVQRAGKRASGVSEEFALEESVR
jgi:hypothetical protein